MALRKLRMFNDALLRKKSKPVKEINENIKMLLDDMRETLHANQGLGLAAAQVGSLKRIFIIESDEQIIEFINPEIIETEGTQTNNEACLSIPGMTGLVDRPEYVKIKALDRSGDEIIFEGTELIAVALCHELDHLDGVLYTDIATEVRDSKDDEEDGENDGEESEAAEVAGDEEVSK